MNLGSIIGLGSVCQPFPAGLTTLGERNGTRASASSREDTQETRRGPPLFPSEGGSRSAMMALLLLGSSMAGHLPYTTKVAPAHRGGVYAVLASASRVAALNPTERVAPARSPGRAPAAAAHVVAPPSRAAGKRPLVARHRGRAAEKKEKAGDLQHQE